MAQNKKKTSAFSWPIFLLMLVAAVGIAGGVWMLVIQSKGSKEEQQHSLSMRVGEQRTLELSMVSEVYTCTSSDDSVLSYDPTTKLITAKSAGQATLTASDTLSDEREIFQISVTGEGTFTDTPPSTTTELLTLPTTTTVATTTAPPPPGSVTGISLSYYSATVKAGETLKYALVTMSPEDATNKNEIWTSSNESIATVDKAGNITGVAAGSCVIRVTSESNPEVFAEVKVTVLDANGNPAPAAEGAASPQTEGLLGGGVGAGSEGPKIENIEGLTYVDGVLIANKTYALPEDYNPGVDPQAQAAFDEMQAAAKKEGISLTICSGFRSYTTQKQLYYNYCSQDGQAAADRYSARPGHSEHQTGLAFDVNRADDSFTGTPEQIWLAENCSRFGFILRYPKGKEEITGYQYESWHVRYLGKDLAKKVTESGKTLEEYYGISSRYPE